MASCAIAMQKLHSNYSIAEDPNFNVLECFAMLIDLSYLSSHFLIIYQCSFHCIY